MNGLRKIAAGALVAGMVLAASASFAQGLRGGGPGGPGRGLSGRIGASGLPVRQLNLTDAQQQLVRDIRQQHRATLRQLEERLRAATESEQAAIQTVPLNEGLIRSSSGALTAARTDLAIEQGRIYNEVWTILTPDQQAQAKKLQSERESQANPRPARRKGQ
jgi:Spy/CpxP family protein refolding chaperone